MGVGGMIVIERLEPDGPGSLMNWVVVSEATLDDNGASSWSLIGPPVDAPWLPSSLYQFEGSSFSFDPAAEPSATPECTRRLRRARGYFRPPRSSRIPKRRRHWKRRGYASVPSMRRSRERSRT
jgi:hypothetical protein